MQINTTETNAVVGYNFTDANKKDNISVNFEPSSVTLPSTGTTKIKLIVEAEEDTYTSNPTITSQTVNITSFEETGTQRDSWNETFDIEILAPVPTLSPLENFSITLTNNNATYLIPLIVTTGFVIWLSRRIDKNMYLTQWIRVKDILTVDASVIAGVLIFLTVGSSEVFSGRSERVIQQVGILTASIVFPFAIAAVYTLIKGKIEQTGIKFMVSGFVYLMASVIIIAFIQK